MKDWPWKNYKWSEAYGISELSDLIPVQQKWNEAKNKQLEEDMKKEDLLKTPKENIKIIQPDIDMVIRLIAAITAHETNLVTLDANRLGITGDWKSKEAELVWCHEEIVKLVKAVTNPLIFFHGEKE